ncbi:MAG TPA: hypothetical protein VIY27_07220 [Myxococcota bacterium]
MRPLERRCIGGSKPGRWRAALAALMAGWIVASGALAGPPPPPPGREGPPLYAPEPPPVWVVRRDPPPLPLAMRAIYAPFYVSGLALRYGVYYALVAPFEVFGRALSYGVEGGVDREGETR